MQKDLVSKIGVDYFKSVFASIEQEGGKGNFANVGKLVLDDRRTFCREKGCTRLQPSSRQTKVFHKLI